MLVLSNNHLTNAYNEAAECDDGCITIVPPPENPEVKMKCKSNGDPHMTTFSGRKIDVQGHGVFPLVISEDVQVEAFHCPATVKWIGASLNAGVAFRVQHESGPQDVVVMGQDVIINGVHTTESTDVVQLKYWEDKDKLRITIGDFKIVIKMKFTPNVPTGYFMNIMVEVPEEDVDVYGKTICGLEEGDKGDALVMPLIPSSTTLFDAESYATLVETCGVPPGDDYEIPEEPPLPCDVCDATGLSCTDAETECRALCECGTEEDIQNCMFDYCALNGDLTAALSCQDTCEDDDDEPETECQEGVTSQYVYYTTQIEEKYAFISELVNGINDMWEKIYAVDQVCPDYHYLHEQYEAEWAAWDNSNTDSQYWPL